ncbi:MAG TPA: hypothetical protein VFS00_16845, partial [Polyangiaceae bacterium]|nr:hypothetical protein [Polyangiaceae bacterium]
MSAPSKNSYLEEVVHQKEQIERELKAQRVIVRGGPTNAAPAAALARAGGGADDTGRFGALVAAAPTSNAVDVRITGWWRWKNVIVPPNALVVHTRRGHAEPLHCGLGVSFR